MLLCCYYFSFLFSLSFLSQCVFCSFSALHNVGLRCECCLRCYILMFATSLLDIATTVNSTGSLSSLLIMVRKNHYTYLQVAPNWFSPPLPGARWHIITHTYTHTHTLSLSLTHIHTNTNMCHFSTPSPSTPAPYTFSPHDDALFVCYSGLLGIAKFFF